MGDRTFKVKARIEAEDRASGEVRKVQSTFGRLTSSLKRNALAIGLSLGGAVLAFRGLTRAIGSTINAAQEQEDSVRALDAALIPLGATAEGVSKRLQEQAAALQQVTKFGDETIIRGQALIASFTRNEEEIQKATIAALDLAAATGTDLKAAFLLMGRAASGETSTLSRYGIILDEGIPKSEKFAAALAKINEQFGGQAQEQAKTFSGVIAQLTNAFGDLQEKLGESITQNDDVLEGLKSLKTTTEEASPELEKLAQVVAIGVVGAFEKSVSAMEAYSKFLQLLSPQQRELNDNLATTEVNAAAFEQTAKRLGITVEELGERLKATAAADDKLAEAERNATTAADAHEKAARKQVASFQTITDLFRDEAAAVKILTDAQKRLLRIQTDLAGSADEFSEGLGRIGVRLSTEVNAEIEKNNELLRIAEDRYKLGGLSAEDYERVQRSVAVANAELAASLVDVDSGLAGVNARLSETAGGFSGYITDLEGAARGSEIFAEAVRRAREELGLEAEQLRRTREELERTANAIPSLGGAQSSFSQVGGGTFTRIDPLPQVAADGTVTIPPVVGPYFGVG